MERDKIDTGSIQDLLNWPFFTGYPPHGQALVGNRRISQPGMPE